MEEIRKVQSDDDLKHIGQERVYGRTVNHAVDVPVSQIREEIGEVIQAMQRGKRQQHSSKQSTATRVVEETENGEKDEEEKEIRKEMRKKEVKGKRERLDGEEESERKRVEEVEDEEDDEDATDWVEVRRRTRWRSCKMVQIFVKVNGSKATPMEVNLTDDKVKDVMKRIQSDEDAYVTMQGKALRTSE